MSAYSKWEKEQESRAIVHQALLELLTNLSSVRNWIVTNQDQNGRINAAELRDFLAAAFEGRKPARVKVGVINLCIMPNRSWGIEAIWEDDPVDDPYGGQHYSTSWNHISQIIQKWYEPKQLDLWGAA